MMTHEQYKQAQQQLGFYGRGKLAGWLDALGISESSHKKYSSGHSPVSPTVERLITALLRIQELEAGTSPVSSRCKNCS
jgi:hypothetical protein